ncbi:hypothetical protein M885DRAFT_516494 [Pelagophyceae sp. CCMP2097]|nr:hypothetical protein M885DRAFT_516494 [Pelagophyceae sp. CCMP2097]
MVRRAPVSFFLRRCTPTSHGDCRSAAETRSKMFSFGRSKKRCLRRLVRSSPREEPRTRCRARATGLPGRRRPTCT